MASRKKGDDDASGDSNPTQMVAMARGLAEVVAEHNLSELIFDTKEVTITVRRGGLVAAAAPIALPAVHALP
ncbi:MAG: hypothetical protein KIT31_42855, partial [Deltaproteobacteria bacterium]|nr:hypothetical protein [Deltaproteobacteria bacterium]